MKLHRSACSMLLVSLAVTLAPRGASGQHTQSATSPLIFRQMSVLLQELELIRFEMGRPKNHQPDIDVTNVSPRHLTFQAYTLLRKADRLSLERTQSLAPHRERLAEDWSLKTVGAVLAITAEQIHEVKMELNIKERVAEPPLNPASTLADVLGSIVQANRQLNILLERQFTPSEVYEQVTVAVGFLSRLLSRFDGATRFPEAPPFQRGKRPTDVFLSLVECIKVVEHIANISGVQTVSLDRHWTSGEHVEPSDVYDIASVLVAELAYLHRESGDIENPPAPYHPGSKFPSHVYQRVGLLQAQLAQLKKLVSRNPQWLRNATGR